MSIQHAILVTGTDTGVGKTLVTSAIAAAIVARGRSVSVYKPVETGCELRDGRRVGADCELLVRAAGQQQSVESAASYLFALPAAPLVAAQAEGVAIDVERIERDFAAVAAHSDATLVEGAGGLLVPITTRLTYLALARRLGLPVLVVVGSRLGCINHALLTIGALEAARVSCVGFVVSCLDAAADGPASPQRNHDTIASLTNARDLGILRYLSEGQRADAGDLAAAVETNIELSSFLDSWLD